MLIQTIRKLTEKLLSGRFYDFFSSRFNLPSRGRKESNRWLRIQCKGISGKVLSVGSGTDSDHEGCFYRDYFLNASSYYTSEVSTDHNCDLLLDVQSMPQVENQSYDCVFCVGVLEHVYDWQAGFKEITRILKTDGILLLGLPFRQAIHMEPNDFWRFTRFGIEHVMIDDYEVLDYIEVDKRWLDDFPSAYIFKARKRN